MLRKNPNQKSKAYGGTFAIVAVRSHSHPALAGCSKGRVDKNRFNGFAGAGKTAEAVEFPSATSHPVEAGC